ncbi:MAG: OmpA family protein [Acidobacteria bacterium]|nr:OmpA family protein [Acidobacteriota bacterium]
MKSRASLLTFVLTLAAALLLVTGCAKKPVTAKVQAPPAPAPQPTVTVNVYPSDITQGQSAKLTWEAQNATNVSIEPIGGVLTSGEQSVSPSQSTTYRIVATGPGGSANASARLTVNVPAPAAVSSGPSLQELFDRNVKDAFFAYDSYEVDSETNDILTANANFLDQHPDVNINIVGHCDERGSEEYNLALGASRAEAVRKSLVSHGLKAENIATNSVGKEQPFCSEHNEECWHLNRRGHIAMAQ